MASRRHLFSLVIFGVNMDEVSKQKIEKLEADLAVLNDIFRDFVKRAENETLTVRHVYTVSKRVLAK